MLAEITAVLEGIKVTTDIAKGLKSAYDSHTIAEAQAQVLEKLTNLRMDTLTLQDKTSEIIEKRDELARKLKEFEDWKATQEKYRLSELQRGKFVYTPKELQNSSEPAHYLCTNCYDHREKSILQAAWHDDFDAKYICPRCKMELELFFKSRPLGPDIPPSLTDQMFRNY